MASSNSMTKLKDPYHFFGSTWSTSLWSQRPESSLSVALRRNPKGSVLQDVTLALQHVPQTEQAAH